MSIPLKALVIDPNAEHRAKLISLLEDNGCKVYWSASSVEALGMAERERPQLIFLDLMIDENDGIEVCIQLRQELDLQSAVVVFMSEQHENYVQMTAFRAGADDFMIKPLHWRVFEAKLRSWLKRMNGGALGVFNVNVNTGLRLDRDLFRVYDSGRELYFPRKQFEILNLLLSKPRKVFSRAEILDSLWSQDEQVGPRTIDVHVRKLREKLGPRRIRTIKGVGYKIENQ